MADPIMEHKVPCLPAEVRACVYRIRGMLMRAYEFYDHGVIDEKQYHDFCDAMHHEVDKMDRRKNHADYQQAAEDEARPVHDGSHTSPDPDLQV